MVAFPAIGKASADVRSGRTLAVPLHLRDAHYPGAKALGRGEGYDYPHDRTEGVSPQELMPDEARGERFLELSDHGEERSLRERLDAIRRARGPFFGPQARTTTLRRRPSSGR